MSIIVTIPHKLDYSYVLWFVVEYACSRLQVPARMPVLDDVIKVYMYISVVVMYVLGNHGTQRLCYVMNDRDTILSIPIIALFIR